MQFDDIKAYYELIYFVMKCMGINKEDFYYDVAANGIMIQMWEDFDMKYIIYLDTILREKFDRHIYQLKAANHSEIKNEEMIHDTNITYTLY